ncbi:hypothetical protein K432DRAFT_85084 [Lepidopterella palustris CBS 459.81]|uniref:Uncharacterized protein n=1 Tax=Lepidopterella palustris CBS 459.81 TaxID=1314670 RepID=A0A8E2E7C8_9PEZI|nr:hypothetical protein K432DRAFT_85084 [Lepidopterella palustris CBS 459.81]
MGPRNNITTFICTALPDEHYGTSLLAPARKTIPMLQRACTSLMRARLDFLSAYLQDPHNKLANVEDGTFEKEMEPQWKAENKAIKKEMRQLKKNVEELGERLRVARMEEEGLRAVVARREEEELMAVVRRPRLWENRTLEDHRAYREKVVERTRLERRLGKIKWRLDN